MFGLSHMPGLTHLTAMHTLRLREFDLEPGALLALPHLRRLHLSVKLTAVSKAEAFVALLPQMQQLTCLQLESFALPQELQSELSRDDFEWPIGTEAYQQHKMQHVKLGLLRLRAIWRHILACGLLPHLQSPTVGSTVGDVTHHLCAATCFLLTPAVTVQYKCLLSAATLVSKYPDLRSCAISLDPCACVDLSAVSQLRGLTELAISNGDPAAAGDLAAACSRVKL